MTIKNLLESVVVALFGLIIMLFFGVILLVPDTILMKKWRSARDFVWNVESEKTVAEVK